jgi:hypothetical protein
VKCLGYKKQVRHNAVPGKDDEVFDLTPGRRLFLLARGEAQARAKRERDSAKHQAKRAASRTD